MLVFLREYSVGELKDDLSYLLFLPPDAFLLFLAVRTCTLGHASQGKEPLTELVPLEDVSY